ncbi:TonB-dependent receptor [Flavihumibacter fluvii]|uniref:TonB-dependent receptor n=1 Tax=Flavihumibacter fluvii TaxID=2838157 RepID=UPI001BDEE26A|nr:TonB-dependent receptor [Flavihumibacter fluvii]ULQ52248.1 TonB-dependent receptor [Flavihumibacter fluvii]
MKWSLSFICLLWGSSVVFAQKNPLGKITGKSLEGATVSVLHPADSMVVKFTAANKNGDFELDQLPLDTYLLSVSAIGYQPFISTPFRLTEQSPDKIFPVIQLVAAGKELGNVTVVAKKPLIENKPDRTIINVDAGISNAGATALEVLEKSPGVTVDRDGNISLRGKQGVLIMLDGKPTYLSGTQLTALLSSMNANQLDQIEIMPNPPSKYDAAGNSGIINIKTKKNKQKGWNGSLTLGYGQGRYWKTNNSLNLNYRNEKFNLFANYNQNINEGFTDLHIIRTYLDETGKTPTAYFDQPTWLKRSRKNNTLKLGLDYFLNKKTTLGIVGTGFISPYSFDGNSTGYIKNGNGHTDSVVQTISDNTLKWTNGSLNLNLRHQFSEATEISADLDYVQYTQTNGQLFSNSTYLPDGTLKSFNQIKGDLPATIRIYAAKTDYSHSFKKGLKLETGLKASFVKTDNTADYFLLLNGQWAPDYQRTNHFLYEEQIQAAYLNARKTIGKWSIQAGLRFEHTKYHGNQLGNPERPDSAFSKDYNSLFPTAFITYTADTNNIFSVNIGRRIDRPAYQQLNPFLFFINEYTYELGNPYLQPQFTFSYELSHTYKGWLTTALNYSNTQQYFSQLFRTAGNVTILSEGNLGNSQSTSLTISAQLNPTKWWSANVSGTGLYQKVQGSDNNAYIRSEGTSGQFNMTNQFKITKAWAAELSGFYNTKSRDGQFIIYPFGQVSAGVSKQVLKGKGSLKLSARDIFFTQVITGDIFYQNVHERFVQRHDSRVVNLSFTWRFGQQFKESGRRNNGGSSEEQRRVGAGS